MKHTKHRSAPAFPPLDPPPAYLATVPDYDLNTRRPSGSTRAISNFLALRGIAARPTLAQLEAERARRGMRDLQVYAA